MVLAPQLYGLLDRRLGGVRRVAYPGRPAVLAGRVSARTGVPQSRFSSPGEQYVVLCPFCGDTSGHLYVSHLYGSEDPTTPGGLPMTHLWRCFRRECQKDPDHRTAFRDMVLSFQAPALRAPRLQHAPPGPRRLRSVPPPGHLIPIQDLDPSHAARVYLTNRGFDLAELGFLWEVAYCAHPCVVPQMEGRIYIPIRQGGDVVMYQGRWPADLDWKLSGIPKYYNTPGVSRSEILYGLDLAADDAANPTGHFVLVEGVADAWAYGPGAIALLGKSLSQAQLSLLATRLSGRTAVIMIDPPAKDEDTAVWFPRIAADLRGRFPGVARAILPGDRDPGDHASCRDLLRAYVRACIEEQCIEVRADT